MNGKHNRLKLYQISDHMNRRLGWQLDLYTVWIKPGEVTIPSDFSQGALIKDGWFQVVAYTGSNELKKLNRGK